MSWHLGWCWARRRPQVVPKLGQSGCVQEDAAQPGRYPTARYGHTGTACTGTQVRRKPTNSSHFAFPQRLACHSNIVLTKFLFFLAYRAVEALTLDWGSSCWVFFV